MPTLLVASVIGCAPKKPPAPATMPANETRVSAYWYDLPAVAGVAARDFDALWRAAEQTARHFGFRPDRLDFRAGVLTTEPLISKQWFEFWRSDVATLDDLADSSIATHRRTLRFDFEKSPDGRYIATPRVVIERYAQAERPITSAVHLRHAFRNPRLRDRPFGTAETDRGVYLPRQYWYATGRDETLERNVAKSLEGRVRHATHG